MTDTFLEDLYREMYQKIYAFARVRLRDEQLAQEVTQDVFVLAQEKLDEVRHSPNPQGWLIRAAGYAVQHAQRDRQYIEQRTVPLEETRLSAPPLEAEDLPALYPETEPYRDSCLFRDCLHHKEKGCAVREAAEAGLISAERYSNYCRFLEEIRARRKY